ncbi:CYTH domain-containing protein [Lacticaseibacillus hulanensis]|uniref:CYTH domain-containing protein n=1 Tax=Lacticaseibacillus hulanensis TaxID=2493111 RepID=UPI000FD91390|nr:CYTH domain-containing protein [Lacticaseibacillus hulanensis]
MPINIENEFKTIITAQQAKEIANVLDLAAPYTQTNTYFDTASHDLQQHKCAARIRQFAGHAEQTIKVLAHAKPRKMIEYTDQLESKQAADLVKAGQLLAPGTVADQMQLLGIDVQSLKPFAKATTTRREFESPAGLLALDQTSYPDGFTDYELEMEYTNYSAANKFFQRLISQFAIKQTPVQSKIARAAKHSSII